jgi:hypothetical protein
MARLAAALHGPRRAGVERPDVRPAMMAASIAAGPTPWRPNRRIDWVGLIDSPRFAGGNEGPEAPRLPKGKARATRCRARQSDAGEPVTGGAATGEQARGCPVAGRASPETESASVPWGSEVASACSSSTPVGLRNGKARSGRRRNPVQRRSILGANRNARDRPSSFVGNGWMTGFEPAASRATTWRSNQTELHPPSGWRAWRDLNPRPTD